MGSIPEWVLVHDVVVEPFTGRNATGPTFGPSVELRGLVSATNKVVRGAQDRQRVASTAIHLAPGTDIHIPLESRITVPGGRVVVAVSVAVRDGGGLPTPDHVHVLCE